MTILWIVVADTNKAVIYSRKKKGDLQLVKEMSDPKTKLKGTELLADRPGHYKTRDSARGAYSGRSGPQEVEQDQFAREIANFLEHNRTKNQFQNLMIIAAPHWLGLIEKHFSDHLRESIKTSLQKNYINLPLKELVKIIEENLRFSQKNE